MSSLQPFGEKCAEEIVASVVDEVGISELRGELIKTSLKRSYYRRLVCGRKVVECLMLRKLGPTSDESLNWEATDFRVKQVNRSNERNKIELERAKEKIANFDRALPAYQSISWKKRLHVEQGGRSGSRRSAKAARSSGGMRNKKKIGRREEQFWKMMENRLLQKYRDKDVQRGSKK